MAVGSLPGARRPINERNSAERRIYIKASPQTVWRTLHDPENAASLFPELTLGQAESTWPAAAARRHGRARVGLLRVETTIESLEARPASRFRLRITGDEFKSEWSWRLEPAVAGGTRVIASAMFQPADRLAGFLARLGGGSLGGRIEAHLVALKQRAEVTELSEAAAR